MIETLLFLTSYQLSVVHMTLKDPPCFTFTWLGLTLLTLKADTDTAPTRSKLRQNIFIVRFLLVIFMSLNIFRVSRGFIYLFKHKNKLNKLDNTNNAP